MRNKLIRGFNKFPHISRQFCAPKETFAHWESFNVTRTLDSALQGITVIQPESRSPRVLKAFRRPRSKLPHVFRRKTPLPFWIQISAVQPLHKRARFKITDASYRMVPTL